MRTRRRAFGPFGPVYFYPEGEGAPGDPPASDPPPAGGSGGAPPAGDGGKPPTPPPAGSGEPMIPKSRFDEINTEYQRLKQAEEQRQADEAKRRGEFEKVANDEKAKREAAEQRALAADRRLAFVTAATGKVADVAAAYKLAAADGVLDSIELDDDGNAKDAAAVGKSIDELVKTYPFLKPGAPTTGRGFGGDHGTNGIPEGVDPSKLSAQELMRIGVAQTQRK